MRHSPFSLRGKILGFYGATLAVVIALEVLAQNAALKAGSEFEARLERYHAIQGLRTGLADFRGLSELYMRERMPEQLRDLYVALDGLGQDSTKLPGLADPESDAFFEARAALRGLETWAPMARSALGMRASGEAASYAEWLKADRLATYVDGYLGRLLSLSLAEGARNYRASSERSLEYRRLALAGIGGAGALAFLFAALFAYSVSAPISRLAEAARRIAAGDLQVEPVEARTGDEVEVLARGFNAMSASIRAMVEGLQEKAALERLLHEETLSHALMGKALREAQFMNLQDHIRPHFLFNALNTIARSALFEEAPETESLALSLGKLLRYSLAEGGSFATVGEELQVLREYLSFQSIRFGPRLSWRILSDPAIEKVLIPRFTLQPIVENAVRHGIEPKVEGGRVLIHARLREGRVRLVVADSGIGMDWALLARLRAAAAGSPLPPEAGAVAGSGGGIGMANLEARLAFRYPGTSRLSMVSRPGLGTLVRISLPATASRDPLVPGEAIHGN